MVAALLLTLLAQPEALAHESVDSVTMLRGPAAWDLGWSDADDRLRGSLRPLDPVSGRPVELSLMVGTFEGAEFDGPLTVTMRCTGWSDTQTVRRAKDERAWGVTFLPKAAGEDCSLDVAFTSTRHKRLHAKLNVSDAPLARWPWLVILGVSTALALGLGIRAVLKKPEEA